MGSFSRRPVACFYATTVDFVDDFQSRIGRSFNDWLRINKLMSEDDKITSQWQSDPRLRYLAPVVLVLGLAFFILILAASSSGKQGTEGLKPFRPSPAPVGTRSNQVQTPSFVELNGNPSAYENQRIRVSGALITLPPPECRLYTGPIFAWGLVAEALQLNAMGHEELVKRLPDGLTLTVEGVWRQYDGPLGCGKGPAAGVTWYLQVERIVSPNPLPLLNRTVVPTLAGGVLTTSQPGIEITPFETGTPGTAVPTQPGIGITPLPTTPPFLPGTQPPPATITAVPTATRNGFMTTTPVGGQTATPTLRPGEASPTAGPGTATVTPTPPPTASGLATQTPAPPGTGYPDPNTPVPTIDPYD